MFVARLYTNLTLFILSFILSSDDRTWEVGLLNPVEGSQEVPPGVSQGALF